MQNSAWSTRTRSFLKRSKSEGESGNGLPLFFCIMLEKVRRYIEEYHMLRAGDTVVAGVSGGADSVCLLRLLGELASGMGFFVTAVHVEHGIRAEESRADAAFTEQLCRELGIPLALYTVDVPRHREETGQSLEEAARELRYECFRRACAEAGTDRIALAHHAEDCAETMLFHLARGTGIRGLGGIRPVSERTWPGDESEENGTGTQRTEGMPGKLTILRPLLCVTRAEIEAWLDERGQVYRTDRTNADLDYARNRIRERVLPELVRINEQAVPHMTQLSGQLARISDFLDEAAWEAGRGSFVVSRDGAAVENGNPAEADAPGPPCSVTIRCGPFLQLPSVLQSNLLLQLIGLAAGGRRDLTAVHVDRVLHLMTAEVGAQASLPGSVTAERTYDTVELHAKAPGAKFLPETELEIPGETLLENGLLFSTEIIEIPCFSEKIPRKSYTKWFDYDKINSVVQLRGRRPGDYFQTDADGGHKKLNRFFIDEKVPLAERDGICLLADGSHILWAVGYRISEAYKVTEETKRVLCVTVSMQNSNGGKHIDG